MKTILVLILFLSSLISCKSKDKTPYVVIFSFDGFRYNQTDSITTLNLNDIAENGVKAQWMIPVFPTVTFPNHYSIATGLYPEHSGIAHNKFYNSVLAKEYDYKNKLCTSDSSYYKGIPLWNYLQCKEIKTATCYWVGSEAKINGKYATMSIHGEPASVSFKNRMDTVLHWLQLPEENRPHLIMAYFSEPDHTGHEYGPFAKQTLAKLQNLDSLLGYFNHQLQKTDLSNKVNIIVLSDHGMANADSSKNIFLTQKVFENLTYRMEGSSQSCFLYAKPDKEKELVDYLQQYQHIKTFSRPNFPKNWHLADTTIVPNLVVVADEGYNLHIEGQKPSKGGCHGYDNTVQSMQTNFYAMGPAFKKGYKQKPFENVDVFSMVCRIFNKGINDTDGNIKDVEGMLNSQEK